jgi:hypothetical protein
MTDVERCGANAHLVGDKCDCDEGYGRVNGKCVSVTAYCASQNAHYNSAIDDCDCNEGYVKNDAGDACDPLPDEPEPTPEEETTIDQTDVMITLQDDPDVEFSVQPLIDASLTGATKTESQTVTKQQASITRLLSLNSEDTELPPTVEQKMDVVKEVITKQVAQDLVAWELRVQAADTAGSIKDEKDRDKFEQLQSQEESKMQQIRDNQDALEVMQKQSIVYMNNDQPFASTLWQNDEQYQNMSKRDFMGETHGDPGEALVNVSQAISAQYELLNGLKDDLRAIKEEKKGMLDIPPQPDLQKELEKVKVDWYK